MICNDPSPVSTVHVGFDGTTVAARGGGDERTAGVRLWATSAGDEPEPAPAPARRRPLVADCAVWSAGVARAGRRRVTSLCRRGEGRGRDAL